MCKEVNVELVEVKENEKTNKKEGVKMENVIVNKEENKEETKTNKIRTFRSIDELRMKLDFEEDMETMYLLYIRSFLKENTLQRPIINKDIDKSSKMFIKEPMLTDEVSKAISTILTKIGNRKLKGKITFDDFFADRGDLENLKDDPVLGGYVRQMFRYIDKLLEIDVDISDLDIDYLDNREVFF